PGSAGPHPRRRRGHAPEAPHDDGSEAGPSDREPAVHHLHDRVARRSRLRGGRPVVHVPVGGHQAGPRRARMEGNAPSLRGGARAARDGGRGQVRRSRAEGAFINAGAYMLEREVLDGLPGDRAVSFERDVFPALVGNGLHAYKANGHWFDIGTPERYLEATRYLLERSGESIRVGEG